MPKQQSTELAARLRQLAPASAKRLEWTQTIEMAAVSNGTGGFIDAGGGWLDPFTDPAADATKIICSFVSQMANDGSWNVAVITWETDDEAATIETHFDATIVPRTINDPAYDSAMSARAAFWRGRGGVIEYLGEPTRINYHGQTKWYSPHRRLVKVSTASGVVLATDGLSTPWSGVPDKKNGIECEIYLPLEGAMGSGATELTAWVHALLDVGDFAADECELCDAVKENSAILFCRLDARLSPFTQMILSVPGLEAWREIPDLPFGSISLLRATPVKDSDLEGLDLSTDWGAEAARSALSRLGVSAVP